MAVALSSDLILDVIRNVDPARHGQAVARLRAKQDEGADTAAFAGLLHAIEPPRAPDGDTPAGTLARQVPIKDQTLRTYEGFEQMVLRNLFEVLMPDEESGAYGTGPSAGVWRSMAADQFASVYADSGGIGIAAALAEDGNGLQPVHHDQWPYFSMGKINSFAG